MAIAVAILGLAGPAAAQVVESDDAAHYQHCMDEAREHPDDGFEDASRWAGQGGGIPAEHCAAIALIGLKEYVEAARRLNLLAARMVREPLSMRAEVLAQSATAWSDAGAYGNAEAALGQAMKLDPADPGYLIDRAVARARQKNFKGAIDDLDRALALAGPRGDALTDRAGAERELGDLKAAAKDADAAVAAAPDLPAAWLERATIRREEGDLKGARQDWLKVLELAPDSPSADAARDAIAAVDIHVPPAAAAAPAPK